MIPFATDVLVALDGPPPGPSLFQSIIPFVLIIGIFYFLMIRPQQKERQAHDALIASLQRDDRVITSSGMHGRIVEVRESSVLVEVADKVRIEFDKSAVARRADAPAA